MAWKPLECRGLKQIDAGVDRAGAGPFLLERDQVARRVLFDRAIARGIGHGHAENGAVHAGCGQGLEHTGQRGQGERVAVQDQPGTRFLRRSAHGVQEPAGRAQWRRFGNTAHGDIFHRLLLEMALDGFGQVAGGKDHLADALRGKIADHPFQERFPIHRRHRLGNVRQQMPDAGAEAAGENDRDDLVGRNVHAAPGVRRSNRPCCAGWCNL